MHAGQLICKGALQKEIIIPKLTDSPTLSLLPSVAWAPDFTPSRSAHGTRALNDYSTVLAAVSLISNNSRFTTVK